MEQSSIPAMVAQAIVPIDAPEVACMFHSAAPAPDTPAGISSDSRRSYTMPGQPGRFMSTITKSIGSFSLALSAAIMAPVALGGGEPMRLIVNGGFAPTVGTTSDYLKAGWNLGTGLVFQPESSDFFALQFDLGYTNFNATSALVQLGQAQNFRTNSGRGDIWSLTAAVKYTMDSDDMRGYGLLGIGAYHRYVELTQTAYGTGYVCDPWWGYCYPGVVYGDVIVGSHSNTKLGYNLGLGIEFPLESDSSWFIEARFHWISGNQPTEYMPIQIGFKF